VLGFREEQHADSAQLFNSSLGEELEALGIGMGLAETLGHAQTLE
jgi:hypothetical protein